MAKQQKQTSEAAVREILWDPDSFGGPEDREPWAEAAQGSRSKAPFAPR